MAQSSEFRLSRKRRFNKAEDVGTFIHLWHRTKAFEWRKTWPARQDAESMAIGLEEAESECVGCLFAKSDGVCPCVESTRSYARHSSVPLLSDPYHQSSL